MRNQHDMVLIGDGLDAKDCVQCGWEQLLTAFPTSDTRDGRAAICKICVKDSMLRSKYGISIEDYNETLDLQGQRCSDCGKKPGNRALSVRKDHNMLQNRWKLVCNSCLIRPGTGRWYAHYQHPQGYTAVQSLPDYVAPAF